jgi:hypothetical protein
VKSSLSLLLSGLAVVALPVANAHAAELNLPKSIVAGSAFSIQSTGSGKGALLIVGPGEVLKRDIQLGETTSFDAGSLYNAGHYIVVISGGASSDSGSFDVVPASQPANLSFFAKPSRLPVGLQNGISGAVYTFDAYQNLITAPTPISFELSNPTGATLKRTVTTRGGAAWTEMDSSPQEGVAKFVARSGTIASTRVIRQVPGDPCGIKMSARPSGTMVALETAPVRDCSGNAVPDGTIVTFTESYNGTQSTVDVPLKRGIAKVEMPAHSGARISVASGVVMGNEIRWAR